MVSGSILKIAGEAALRQNIEETKDYIKNRNVADIGDVKLTNLQNGQVLKYDSVNKKWVNRNDDSGGSGLKIGDVSGAAYSTTAGVRKVTITWSDPSDVEVSGVKLAEWQGTKLVRKAGSAPISADDGTLLVNSTTRNEYSSDGYEDADNLSYDTVYYYRFFPYTTGNLYTEGSALNVVLSRKALEIPSPSDTLAYNTTEQTMTFSGYDSTKMTGLGMSGTDAGDYTATFTPLEDYMWATDNSTSEKTVSWSISPKSLIVPTVTGSFTYDTTQKTCAVETFDANEIEQDSTSTTSATDAGTYYVYFNLVDSNNYEWSDSSTSQKYKTWSIAKANGSATLSSDSVTLNNNDTYKNITISNATGTIGTPTSSDTSVCTVTKNGDTITINNVNKNNGTATITIPIAEATNYKSTSVTISVTATFATVYGAEWDGTSTTAWSRTDAAQNFTDPVPAVGNGSGSSPFDNCKPWSEMARVTDSDAGTLVKIPKYWYKWTRSGTKMKLQISDSAKDGFLVSPAHADRGDGKGERDVVYVGAYHCATSTYKSTTGVQPANNITRANFRTNIHNLGSTIWQYDYAMYWTIMMLYLVEFADWNSQAKIGYGCSDSGSVQNSGLCDAMTYHTGTNAANRTTYGHTRYRWIEDLWGNVYDWCDGIYFSSSDVYCIKNPSKFSDTTGGTKVSTRPTSSNYISAWSTPTASGFEYALYPSAVSGSSSTYICDYWFYNSSGVVLFVGGSYVQDQYFGAFYLDGNLAASRSYSYVGSRLQKLP